MGNVISITAARNIKAIAQADREASLKYNSGAQNFAIGEFLVGHTYTDRSPCDYNCVFEFTVTARSKSFVTLEKNGKSIGKKKVYRDSKGEYCKPLGDYSMCVILRS